jgi:DNA-binding ferritin-like protein
MGLAFWRVYHENAQQAVAEGEAEKLPISPLQALEGVKSESAGKAKEAAEVSAEAVVKTLKAERQEVLDRVRERSKASEPKSDQPTS